MNADTSQSSLCRRAPPRSSTLRIGTDLDRPEFRRVQDEPPGKGTRLQIRPALSLARFSTRSWRAQRGLDDEFANQLRQFVPYRAALSRSSTASSLARKTVWRRTATFTADVNIYAKARKTPDS
jgi:hypothetical protein